MGINIVRFVGRLLLTVAAFAHLKDPDFNSCEQLLLWRRRALAAGWTRTLLCSSGSAGRLRGPDRGSTNGMLFSHPGSGHTVRISWKWKHGGLVGSLITVVWTFVHSEGSFLTGLVIYKCDPNSLRTHILYSTTAQNTERFISSWADGSHFGRWALTIFPHIFVRSSCFFFPFNFYRWKIQWEASRHHPGSWNCYWRPNGTN